MGGEQGDLLVTRIVFGEKQIAGVDQKGRLASRSQLFYQFSLSGQTAQLVVFSAAGLDFSGDIAGEEQGVC